MKLLYLIFNLLLIFSLNSQCPDFEVYFESQNQIDSFTINFPDCKVLNHNIYIANTDGGIFNLDGLSMIEGAMGSVQISQNPDLFSIDGLKNLRWIDGILTLSLNDEISDYTIFKELESLGGLRIENINPNSVFNFSNIDKISSIKIWFRDDTFTLTGFQNLIEANVINLNGDIDISQMVSLEKVKVITLLNGKNYNSFDQFINLGIDSVELITVRDFEEFNTRNINSIKNIEWMSLTKIINLTLDSIGKVRLNKIAISECKNIEKFDELNDSPINSLSIREIEQLETLGQYFYLSNLMSLNISNNKKLYDISALSFPSNKFRTLNIIGNEHLSDCSIESICHVIEQDSIDAIIEFNNSECNSKQEVIENCLLDSNSTIDNFHINIWPNPISEYLNINLNQNLSFKLYSIDGTLLKSGQIFNERIYLGDINSGVYIIRIENNQVERTLRIIKL